MLLKLGHREQTLLASISGKHSATIKDTPLQTQPSPYIVCHTAVHSTLILARGSAHRWGEWRRRNVIGSLSGLEFRAFERVVVLHCTGNALAQAHMFGGGLSRSQRGYQHGYGCDYGSFHFTH